MVRFQFVIPQGASRQTVEDLKRTTYSFRGMRDSERKNIRPTYLDLVTAKTGDTIASLANGMAVDGDRIAWFRALNGLGMNENVISGQRYKVVR